MSGTAVEPPSYTDRLLLNTVLVVNGVAVGFAATVLLSLIRSMDPWASWESASLYAAWGASFLLVALAFVSQVLGSRHSTIVPTTPMLLAVLVQAVAEFVGLGMLEPRAGFDSLAGLRSWLIATAVVGGSAAVITSIVLAQIRSESLPSVTAESHIVASVRADRTGACTVTLTALLAYVLSSSDRIAEPVVYCATLLLLIFAVVALQQQQRKLQP